MSPGQTFERVYLELKRQLHEGTRPPGTPLEPTAIGDELGTSFTPVRDALHRLVGESLVENPRHNGSRFRIRPSRRCATSTPGTAICCC
jgi:DNA-binding GntR family transcriptional regulator